VISYVLFCILWSKPQTQLIEVPVNEYAMAVISQDFQEFHFDADVIEEKINSLKITHIPTQISTEAHSTDAQQRSMYLKMEMADKAASLTCELRAKTEEKK
jgi:hypothetical protein